MHILVDMDGTIADFDAAIESRLREEGIELVPAARRVNVYIREDYPAHHRTLIERTYERSGFFRALEPIEGAAAALEEMVEAGHDVTICTTPLVSNETCMNDKYDWVREHLGEAYARTMIQTEDKTAAYGDVLIDDRPEVEGRFTPTWQHVLYDQPYNRGIHKPRIRCWSEWAQVLEDLPPRD